jgi:pyrimidine-nucleoside phosphorylase
MIPQQLISRKRDGLALAPDELRAFLRGYVAGEVAEYQMAAFLMAVVFQGLSDPELSELLDVMVSSGAVLDWPGLDRPVVDKHSTGGVGDKVSLALAPLLAEVGFAVPMISGRGLGHTGGTLDKLEALPGFRTALPLDEFNRIVRKLGLGMIGQTAEIAPLDRRLYDLRNVTGTVPVPPLMATSIMSKKMAEGLDALLLDVKVGSGAFLPDPGAARRLAELMVRLGEGRGIRTVALLTAMDRPLGETVGNALETREALDCLRGGGPGDLRELVLRQAAELVLAAEPGASGPDGLRAAMARAEEVLDSGRPMERFLRLVEAQGGDPVAVESGAWFTRAPVVDVLEASEAGTVTGVEPRGLGEAVVAMGGGRTALDQEIDARVGFRVLATPGQVLQRGQALVEIHAASPEGAELGREAAEKSIAVAPGGAGSGEALPLVVERIGA